jgi:hypothetical protein
MSIELSSPASTAHGVLEGVHRAISENPEQKEAIIATALEIFGDIRKELAKSGQDMGVQNRSVNLMQHQIEQLRPRNEESVSEIESIEGKGDCLFLSVGYGLVNLYNSDNKEALLHSLGAKKDEFKKKDPELSRKIGQLIECVSLGKSPKNTEKLVYLLRDIACRHNEKRHPYRAEGSDYFRRMRKSREWGTDAEILAFSEVLGIRIGLTNNLTDYVVLGESGPEISIRHQRDHFDLVKVRNVYQQTIAV